MTALPGVRSPNITSRPAVSDDIVVNRDRTTGLQSVENLARQLAGTAPIRYLNGAAPIFETAEELLATDIENPVSAWVIGDPDINKIGIWGYDGSDWAWALPLPYDWIVAIDEGAGSPNAIQATTKVPVFDTAMIHMEVADTNTGSPVTVSFNGGTAKTIKTNSGNNISAGGLVAGMVVMGILSGSIFRLLSDQVAEAIVAAAEDAAARAEAAAASVENQISNFDTEAVVTAAQVPAAVHSIRLSGGVSPGDGLGGLYVDEPNGKPASFTSGGTTARSWYKARDVRGDSREGQVATRCVIPGFSNTTNKQILSRTRHFARDILTGLRLIYPNWFHNGDTETGIDGTITVSASVEYPEGQLNQVKWAGSASIVIADRTSSAPSDLLAIEIPDGAEFFVRTYSTSAAGILFSATEDTIHGEGSEFGPSGITDKTMSGTISDNGNNAVYGPCAIIGATTKPSVFVVGDSRESAAGFDIPNSLSAVGHVARAVSPMCAYIDVSRGGERLAEFVAAHSRRVALAQYCSHAVIHMGINDFTAGQTSASALANLATIIGYFPTIEVWLATIEPVTTSSDGWITGANQTIDATSNSNRIAFNDAIRAGVAGVAGFFDIADVFESARNSGKWKAPAGVALTSDGTHETLAGYEWGEQSRVIDPNRFIELGVWRPRFATRKEVLAGKASGVMIDPAGLGVRAAFRSTKNGVDQTVTSASSTKITWTTKVFDTLNGYDVVNSRWVPPAGQCRIHGQLYVTAGVVDAAQFQVRIAKNGATVAEFTLRPSGTAAHSLCVDAVLQADGDDYFEIWVNLGGAGDKTVSGDATRTYFEGYSL
jgi:hypothetical protein